LLVPIALFTSVRHATRECFAISEVAAAWHKLMIIHCLRWQTVGPIVQCADIPHPNQPHKVAHTHCANL